MARKAVPLHLARLRGEKARAFMKILNALRAFMRSGAARELFALPIRFAVRHGLCLERLGGPLIDASKSI